MAEIRGVAIPMQLTGDLEKTINAVPLLPFDERVLDLLNDLSNVLSRCGSILMWRPSALVSKDCVAQREAEL